MSSYASIMSSPSGYRNTSHSCIRRPKFSSHSNYQLLSEVKAGNKLLNGCIIGAAYVGLATIAGFIWWFIYSDSGPKLTYNELVKLYVVLSCYRILHFILRYNIWREAYACYVH